jgi:two-component system OmpR family sensor kinase
MLLATGVLVAAVVLAAGVLGARRRERAAESLRSAEAAGRRAERDSRRRFLARLDHELKNPLTAIRAAVAAGDDDAGRARATLVSQSTRLASLVSDLRKLAELETQEIEDEDVDMAEVVRDAVEDVIAQAVATGGPPPDVVVTLPTVPWPLPHVRGDVDLLYLAVYNLLGNAVKFSPPGTRIEVRGTDEDGTVVVEVADSGPGIPPDEVDVVFDELARGRDARGLPGSGLGLALVRVIAARHAGRATLRSRPGQGTSVRLHLPTRPAQVRSDE